MAELAPGSVTTLDDSNKKFNDVGGNNDPGDGQGGGTPSDKTAGKGTPAPSPYFLSAPTIPLIGSPISGTPVITDQLHLGGWKIYVKNNKMYASNGLHELQFVMINPGGLTQTSKPNSLSDGSDKSSKASAGNTAVSGRTVPQNSTGTTNAAGSTPAGNSAGVPSGNNVDNILRTIKTRESKGDYTAQAKTSSASGAYQFIDSTWRNLSQQAGYGRQYARAKDAPPAVQDAVARYYVNDILRRSGGDINAVPNEWYTGNIYGNMTGAQLAANRGLTSAQYRSNFFSTFNSINGSNNTALAYTDSNTPSNAPAAFANMSPGQGFPSAIPSNINTAPSNANSLASSTDQLANSAEQALGGTSNQTLTSVPCMDKEITDALNKLTPGGLTGLVLDLTSVTKDLSKLTKQIADLLPGVPFNITSQIIKLFTEGFKDLNDAIGPLEKELTGGLNRIVAELNCISKDLNAVSSGINKVINSWTNAELIKMLPSNLSLDDLIDGKANSALINIQLTDTTTAPRGTPRFTEDGIPIFTEDQINRPIELPSPSAQISVPELQVELEAELEVESEIKIVETVENIIINEPIEFKATCDIAKPYVTERLGRALTDKEWTALIAATYEVAGENAKEVVWFAMTVINRSAKTGVAVDKIIEDFLPIEHQTQKFVYGPLFDYEVAINQAILNYGSSVPTNNYYFDSFRAEVRDTTTYMASRKGITGIAVGQSFVYPGAKWP